MQTLRRLSRRLWNKGPLLPLQFPVGGFEVISDNLVLEEELIDDFKAGIYYPVNIGDVFNCNYQIVGKLGFGTTSTVWLARDLLRHGFATLKVYTRDDVAEEEFKIYKTLSQGNQSHPGFPHVRTAIDLFTIPRQGGNHHCLVQKPTWDSFRDLLKRNPKHRFTEELLKVSVVQVLLGLSYLHDECRLVHTDLKADNIMIEIEDESILDAFVQDEISHPSSRKVVENAVIYASRQFRLPKYHGKGVLSDFGSAVQGDQKQVHDAQPNVYRCPEVMLKTSWSYPADIWNVGCMIWDLFEDKHLFYGNDPDGSGYKTRAHLAEVVGLLGLPPTDFLDRGSRSSEFFDKNGAWIADVPIPETTLEMSEENLDGPSKEAFIRFMGGLLQWKPEDRKTAKQLLKDPWLADVRV